MRLASNQKLGLVLIVGLAIWSLILQILFLAETADPDIHFIYSTVISYIGIAYLTSMYLGVAILIWIEINNLEEFHVDKFTIVTFILGAFLQQRLEIEGGVYFSVLRGLAGISLVIAVAVRKPKSLRTSFRWALAGVLFGAILIIGITYLELLLRQTWTRAPLILNSITITISNLTIRELFTPAVLEEVLFRGFLWGYLRRQGWQERKIFWTQGLLFWITHFGRLITPFTFFVAIPVLTLVTSKLVSRTKQVFPAILAHAVINILSAMLNLATY